MKKILYTALPIILTVLTACGAPDTVETGNTTPANVGQTSPAPDTPAEPEKAEVKDGVKAEVTPEPETTATPDIPDSRETETTQASPQPSAQETAQPSAQPVAIATVTAPDMSSYEQQGYTINYDILSAKLDFDYTGEGELFPGSYITVKNLREAKEANGCEIASFQVYTGTYADNWYTACMLLNDSIIKDILGDAGIWGDGTKENADYWCSALLEYGTLLAGESYDIEQPVVASGTASGEGADQQPNTQPNPPASTITDGQHGIVPGMLDAVNEDRADNGAEALAWSDELAGIALQRALDVKANFDAYDGEDETVHGHDGAENYGIGGENVCVGYGDGYEANTAWINSSSHHATRTSTGYTEYACAMLYIPASEYGTYWVEIFR